MTPGEVLAFGVIGGALPEFYAIYRIRHYKKESRPLWLSSGFYWITTIFMVALGGGTAFLYHHIGVKINPMMAIHLGLATPVLIQTAIKEKPKID
ncbi:hypothetical protein CLH62_17010 [Marinobacter guineae]|uniref:Uncharacterized protein n=1 Tax=Marinobacter guineae TaxID=432303 RepID=A0A2G1VDG3_9GAMM|nr:hypothetical protein [Marinobacter guineae]PHQ24589.1 hypothetical protein CLH62_17010 [Marinobacter guineae]